MTTSTIVGMVVPLALYLAYSAFQSMFPPTPPLLITDVRSFNTARNTWMIAGHASFVSSCDTLVFKRVWDGIPQGIVPPVVASSNRSTDQQFLARHVAGDEVDFWVEFQKAPGFAGIYRLTVSATGCANGFVGPKTVLDQRFSFPSSDEGGHE